MTAKEPPSLRPRRPVARSLARLVDEFGFEVAEGSVDDVELTGVSLSSGDIVHGDLYVGVAGRRRHGAEFARAAVEAGAVAVLTDAQGVEAAADAGVPVLVTDDPRAALGAVAAWVHRTDEFDATLFAVTGTNGKTSVVYVLSAVLDQLGVANALSSTAERKVGSERVVSALTTPEATELHALLARAREEEVRAVAVEVSAQALDRHRVDGVVFDVAGFTNLSRDHFDDYSGMEEYYAAKLQLFQPGRAERAVVTVDDAWGRRLAEECRIPVTTLASTDVYADWRVADIESSLERTAFTLTGPDGRSIRTSIPLLGEYMASNAALAIVMLVEAGHDLEGIAHVLDRDGGIDVFIPGRTERVSGEKGPVVFIDYAHTPDGYARSLAALRPLTAGRLIMVFGADGDRDREKRPEMGAIAARGADVLFVTDYNPRFEDPAAIRAALIAGAREARPDGELYEVPDPREAIRRAVEAAEDGDVIFYAGPGHEDHQEVAGALIPYSARDDARLALAEAGWL